MAEESGLMKSKPRIKGYTGVGGGWGSARVVVEILARERVSPAVIQGLLFHRDAIEATYPQVFRDFNKRMWQPGGFPRPLGARERKWNTKSGKANFAVPKRLSASADIPEEQRDVLQLTTLRANDQFNTTIYDYNDRYRGVYGTRMVLFISANDMKRLG